MASIQFEKPSEHIAIHNVQTPIPNNFKEPSTEKSLNKPNIPKTEHPFGEKVKDVVHSVARKVHRRKKQNRNVGDNDTSSSESGSGSSSSSSESEQESSESSGSDNETRSRTKKAVHGTGKKKAVHATVTKAVTKKV